MKILVLLTMALLLMGSIYAKKDCEVKFISYNIRYEGAAADTGALDWKNRKEATVNMIRQEQPSVIGFQEPRPTQTTFVIEQFPDYGHVYAKMDKGEIPAGSPSSRFPRPWCASCAVAGSTSAATHPARNAGTGTR